MFLDYLLRQVMLRLITLVAMYAGCVTVSPEKPCKWHWFYGSMHISGLKRNMKLQMQRCRFDMFAKTPVLCASFLCRVQRKVSLNNRA